MNNKNRKKIIWIVIFLSMILTVSYIEIMERFNYKNKELEPETKIENIETVENSIFLFSDGSVNSFDNLLKNETLEFLFENSEYGYSERVKEYGVYNSINPIVNCSVEEIKSTEFIVINGGFLDLVAENEIGDFDSDDKTFVGYLVKVIEKIKEISPKTKIILIGIPSYNYEEIKNYKYSIADYNFALETVSDKYDNVYYVDLFTKTKETPLSIKREDYKYKFEIINLIYESLIEKLDEIKK